MIGIIDYGYGNINSLSNMLEYLYINHVVISSPVDFIPCSHYLLPGVGAFDAGMQGLRDRQLVEIIHSEVVSNSKPLLGICLGMHLLCNSSAEGQMDGLGLVDASVEKLLPVENFKVPNMGWQYVIPQRDCCLVDGCDANTRFYFVHSYGVKCHSRVDIVAESRDHNSFVQVLQKKNIFGVQFHPEKSHRYGMRLLQKFYEVG